MQLPITPSEIGPRLSAGAFILNSGLSKMNADEATARNLHGFASGTYPFLAKMDDKTFLKVISTSEIAIGAMLIAPIVPTAVAGAALTAFSAGLLGLYLRTPGMRKPGSLAPTQEGLALAKDSWLVGIGIGLLVKGTLERDYREARRAEKILDRLNKKAAKAAKKAKKAIA